MARFTREELSGRINELDIPEDVKMSLIEDITDSIVDPDTSLKEEYEKSKLELEEQLSKKNEEYDSLYNKYKERFFSSDSSKVESLPEQVEVKNDVIDVKEIF